MDTQKVQFAAGLKVVRFFDAYNRETEVCIGHRDIMVTHKTTEGETESMRRYTRNEIEMIMESLGEMK